MKIRFNDTPTLGRIPANILSEFRWLEVPYDPDLQTNARREEAYGYEVGTIGYVVRTKDVITALGEDHQNTSQFLCNVHVLHKYLWFSEKTCELVPD